jgi:hypothetical protein
VKKPVAPINLGFLRVQQRHCTVGVLSICCAFSNQLITPISLFGTSPPEAIKLTPLLFSLFLFSG